MAERTYYAKRIVQWEGAPALYVISIEPADLLSWADVPRKAPKAMAGYQRHLDDDRAADISEFMEAHINHIVPGTVIVSSEKGSGDGDLFSIDPVEVDGVEADAHNLFKITFNYEYDVHPDEITTDQLKEMLEDIIETYDSRLTEEEKARIAENGDVDEPEEEAPDDINEEDIEEENLTKGSGYTKFVKRLHELRECDLLSALDADEIEIPELQREGASEAEIAQQEADILKAEEEAMTLGSDRREAGEWKEWIISEHKIGNIMDGQHRVWGAMGMNPDDCAHLGDEDEPVISVTLVPNLIRAEQVFQFAMMNLTPVKVKPGLARSGAIHSLTMAELDAFDERMREYMDVTSARWMNELYTNANSPFRGMLTWDFLEDPDIEFVDEKIMAQITKRWYKRTSKSKLIGPLYIGGGAWNNDDPDGHMLGFRLEAFFVFWQKIAEKFPLDWADKGSNIWRKVSLWVLQDWVRKEMMAQRTLWVKSAAPPLDDLDSLAGFVEHCLSEFPGDFFRHPWTGVDDTPFGRDRFFAQFDAQNNREKVNKKTWLFKGAGS